MAKRRFIIDFRGTTLFRRYRADMREPTAIEAVHSHTMVHGFNGSPAVESRHGVDWSPTASHLDNMSPLLGCASSEKGRRYPLAQIQESDIWTLLRLQKI